MTEREYEVIHENRICSASGCKNVITHWAQKKGYVGPVYCITHMHLADVR